MVSIGTSAKCRSYMVMLLKADTLFFKTQSHLFIRYARFFHFMLFLLSKIVFLGVQKLKSKRFFRKIEIIHVRHIVSSVAQKRNSVDFSNPICKMAMLSKVLSKIQNRNPQVIWILGLQVFLNFFPHVYINHHILLRNYL